MPALPIKTIDSSAPVRICDIGGWTDTWFAGHGQIFNIAVTPTAEVQIKVYPKSTQKHQVIISPENFGAAYPLIESTPGPHPLLESAIKRIGFPPNYDLFISVHSDVPPGCSTGTSASICVALIGALFKLNSLSLSPKEIITTAHLVETVDLCQQSGVQDQICAAYGGINYIELKNYPSDYKVIPLKISKSLLNKLDRLICLVFLGRRHTSSDIHQAVIASLQKGGAATEALLNPLRQAALLAKNAMEVGDFTVLGRAALENNEAQRHLHPDLICPDADSIIRVALKHGAFGAKVNGAGGNGGSVTIISSNSDIQKQQMITEILSLNPAFQIIPTHLSQSGLKVW